MRARTLATALSALVLGLPAVASADFADEVDPMIGTFAPGFVFPGPSVPFGMVQNSPDTVDPADLAYTGYLYHDPQIRGFSLVHINGAGVHKAGDLPFMPTTGAPSDDPATYAAPFDHAREHAAAGYYDVTVGTTDPIRVELTAGLRTAMQRYSFPAGSAAKVIMDIARSTEGTAPSHWEVTGPSEVTGWRTGRYPVYFVARFSRPFASHGDFAGKGGWVGFDTASNATVTMRAGISFVDADGARANLDAETSDFDFDAMRERAHNAWQRELRRVRIKGGVPTDRRAFYTALFHAYQHPNVFTDSDGRYRGFDNAIHVATGRTQYANFSSWDTYKAQNQLLAITQPARYREMLLSLLADAQEGGRLPRWGEQNFDAAHMSGDPAIPMIADAYCRNLLDVPTAQALYDEAVELRSYRPADVDNRGYIPMKPGTTLEYGVADFALALMAKGLGHDADADAWAQHSLNYRNLMDPASRWIRPRQADGSWYAPFNAALDETGFQEGNAWQYSWLAPHDAAGLFSRMGGVATVDQRFARFFAAPGPVQNQATMFGTLYRTPQYAPGNEHDIQAPWMPAFTDRPWQVALAVRNARTVFRATPDGLPGNDDLGSLSAWHVMSALGLGPVTPGAPFYVVGSPQFDSATLVLPRKRRFTITAKGTAAHMFVRAATLDGKPLDRDWFYDSDLRDGGSLVLTMAAKPSPTWATGPGATPPSLSTQGLAAFGCGR